MKMIEATIRHFKQDRVIEELNTLGIPGVTVTELQRDIGGPDRSILSVRDILDVASIARNLKQTTRPVDEWLAGELSGATKAALENYQGASSEPEALKSGLVMDLNRVIRGDRSINDLPCFDEFSNFETEKLCSQNVQGADLRRLNRLLLGNAYPRELARSRISSHGDFDMLAPMIKLEICLPADLVESAIRIIKCAAKTASTFSGDDFVDLPSLAEKLAQPRKLIDTWIAHRLSPETVRALRNFRDSESDLTLLEACFVRDFNQIIRGPPLYGIPGFANLVLRAETQKVLSQHPQGDDLVTLNRLLFGDAFKMELATEPRGDDGFIIVSDVERCIRIRTGEEGEVGAL